MQNDPFPMAYKNVMIEWRVFDLNLRWIRNRKTYISL